MKNFNAKKLNELRILNGLSMDDLAVKIGTSKSSVSHWEAGERPKPGNLKKLAKVLGVEIAAFFLLAVFFTQSAHAAAELDRVAAAHIGRGETVADNTGPWVERYTGGSRVPWCAGFVSYVLREAGHDLPYTLWARDFARRGVYGRLAAVPARGEVVVFKRGAKSGHAAIVDQVIDSNHFWIIEGNHGAFPARVKRSFVDRTKDYGREVIAFVKI